MGSVERSRSSYSAKVCAVFLFNLLIGVGVLALPGAVARAGILSGTLCLIVVCFMAFMSLTFVIEALASANAWKGQKGSQEWNDKASYPAQVKLKTDLTQTPLFEIKEQYEMGYMVELFMGSTGATLFYTVLCLYLYGDLAIYAVSVATTLETVIGASHAISYYSFLWGFLMLIGPFCFFDFQKTTYLQLFTMIFRNLAMLLLVVLTVLDVIQGNGVQLESLVLWDSRHTKELLGVAVFSFMCHHSIPSIVVPLKDKSKVLRVTAVDYLLVLAFSLITALSASLNKPASEICALYTLNFREYPVMALSKFLTLYPVFTLSSNFPLICITLRNNLLSVFPVKGLHCNRQLFTLVALLPPMVVAVFVQDVGKLVVLTGSFAGLAIMFVIPGLLVLSSRAKLDKAVGLYWREVHPHRSPFRHNFWVYLSMVFALSVLLTRVF